MNKYVDLGITTSHELCELSSKARKRERVLHPLYPLHENCNDASREKRRSGRYIHHFSLRVVQRYQVIPRYAIGEIRMAYIIQMVLNSAGCRKRYPRLYIQRK